jgi:PKD repeat protein
MNRIIWISVVVVVLGVGGWWYLNHPNVIPVVKTQNTTIYTEGSTPAYLVGRWSTSNEIDRGGAYTLELMADGSVIIRGGGEIKGFVDSGTWTVFSGDKPSEEVPVKLVSDSMYLKLSLQNKISIYTIEKVTPTEMRLTDMQTNITNTFEAQPSTSNTQEPPPFTANVSAGHAPLLVEFSLNYWELADFWVDFGDGAEMNVKCTKYKPGTDACVEFPTKVSHTYSQPGTYTAKYEERDGKKKYVVGSVVVTVK